MNEFNQEFLLQDWTQFSNDIQKGNLINIDEILSVYVCGKIGIDDILSIFPPSELPLLQVGNHRELIQKYSRLIQEFPDFYG
ncbi:hypothetical protein ND861_10290 [Leptospira sp. 2 VSF19]|uniref:Uncharacterized protein n=1 Tax=Leptospira soteropolitanensis TaxID=2950025 RepID=A0ABT3MIM5_9LEPT|nr:hypothetical protein [Leptospira soteropolitanensis]MCW7526736.1 hypothetical protein [Leptospira soteropolitanensis]